MQMTVCDLMTRRPTVVWEQATIREALISMLRDEVGEVYVTDEAGRLCGVVPDYEVFKARLARISDSECVERLMSRSVATTHPKTPISEIIPIFRDASSARLAVVEEGHLVGRIERRDVLRLLVTLDELDMNPATAAAENRAPSETPMPAPRFIKTRQEANEGSSLPRPRGQGWR